MCEIRISTKHCQYARQLRQLFKRYPQYDVAEIARRIGKSEQWVRDYLSLTNLHFFLEKKLDAGELTKTRAIELARLTKDEQLKVWEADLD